MQTFFQETGISTLALQDLISSEKSSFSFKIPLHSYGVNARRTRNISLSLISEFSSGDCPCGERNLKGYFAKGAVNTVQILKIIVESKRQKMQNKCQNLSQQESINTKEINQSVHLQMFLVLERYLKPHACISAYGSKSMCTHIDQFYLRPHCH